MKICFGGLVSRMWVRGEISQVEVLGRVRYRECCICYGGWWGLLWQVSGACSEVDYRIFFSILWAGFFGQVLLAKLYLRVSNRLSPVVAWCEPFSPEVCDLRFLHIRICSRSKYVCSLSRSCINHSQTHFLHENIIRTAMLSALLGVFWRLSSSLPISAVVASWEKSSSVSHIISGNLS